MATKIQNMDFKNNLRTNGSLLKYEFVKTRLVKSQEQHTKCRRPPAPIVLNFLCGNGVMPQNLFFLRIIRQGIIFRESVKKAVLFSMKFPIRILLAYWPTPRTKVGNFPPRRRKLQFLLFEITSLAIFEIL